MREFYSRVLDRKVLTSRAQACTMYQDMKQYILNAKNSLGEVDSHIEDYRTEERMEQRFSRIKEVFRSSPQTEVLEEGDRYFKVKTGRVVFEYYITEREI
jgi:hypothetical protein